jgi:hypothetical protein
MERADRGLTLIYGTLRVSTALAVGTGPIGILDAAVVGRLARYCCMTQMGKGSVTARTTCHPARRYISTLAGLLAWQVLSVR